MTMQNNLLDSLMQFLTAYTDSEQAFITPKQEKFVREGLKAIIDKYESGSNKFTRCAECIYSACENHKECIMSKIK